MTITLQEAPMLACQIRAENASPGFTRAAMDCILATLAERGAVSGESLTAACRAHGIVPADSRSFGAAFKALSHEGKIVCIGYCLRARGHGAAGGRIWSLTP